MEFLSYNVRLMELSVRCPKSTSNRENVYSTGNDISFRSHFSPFFTHSLPPSRLCFLPSIAGNGLLGLQLLLGTILMEYGLTSCWVNCSSGSILTMPWVSVKVASQALSAFSKCCNASLCSIKFDEFGFCDTGVVLCDGALAVLDAAIVVASRKLAFEPPSSDWVSSRL